MNLRPALVVLLGAAAAVLAVLSSGAASADAPAHSAPVSSPQAKRVNAPMPAVAAVYGRFTVKVWTDENYGGDYYHWSTAGADCNNSGYTYYTSFLSRARATSSVQREPSSPMCNAVTLTNTFGVKQSHCLSWANVGPVMNDIVAVVHPYHSKNC